MSGRKTEEEAGSGDSECKSVGSNEARWKL
jgi:hypothetical protein